MPKFIKYCSKTIDIGILVEADTLEEAEEMDVSNFENKVVFVGDGGWDVWYDTQQLGDDESELPYTNDELRTFLVF